MHSTVARCLAHCRRCADALAARAAVYVLDTGVRSSGVNFQGRLGEGASMLGGSFQDDHSHGSHVSGTAIGGVHGAASGAILHPVKVMPGSKR